MDKLSTTHARNKGGRENDKIIRTQKVILNSVVPHGIIDRNHNIKNKNKFNMKHYMNEGVSHVAGGQVSD